MDIEQDAAASARAGIAPSRRALLIGGAVLASGLPLMTFAAASAQGASPVSQLLPQPSGVTMPKIIIHAADGTFDPNGRAALAAELADFALDCEALPKSPFMKSTVWTYFSTYPADAVFMGGAPAYAQIISAQLFVIAGGLDEQAKTRLIKGATDILGRHSAAHGTVPVYIVLHEIPETDWGFLGETADLATMRASPPDKPAF